MSTFSDSVETFPVGYDLDFFVFLCSRADYPPHALAGIGLLSNARTTRLMLKAMTPQIRSQFSLASVVNLALPPIW